MGGRPALRSITYNTRRGGIARAVREVDILGKTDTFTCDVTAPVQAAFYQNN